MSENNSKVLVDVQGLKMHFPVNTGTFVKRKIGAVKAVDGVSFDIMEGETMGLVGESGSGKTTTGQSLLRVYNPTAGKVYFDGQEVMGLDRKGIQLLRRRMQMIFQDPFGSLNPRMKVSDIVGEPLKIHKLVNGKSEFKEKTAELLRDVGLDPVMGSRYPHEFSGGQRQRIGIARALSVNPSFIVCDEPVSALDVSIQAQIINLLEDLQEKYTLTYLFIAHDLAVVRHISNRIAVMYLGKIVEISSRLDLYDNPLHPYTKALLSAVPIPNPTVEAQREHIVLKGEVPSPMDPPTGCCFHPRCAEARQICSEQEPILKEADRGHKVACHLFQ